MEKVFFFGGIAGVIGGFVVILYQGLTYLSNNVWNSFSLLTAVDHGPASLADSLAASPALFDFLDKCPLSAALIVFGLILLWGAGRLRSRFA